MRLRNFCFTINNWTEQQFQSVFIISSKYCVVGKEIGESGTPHLQGYMELVNAISFDSLKKKLPTAHIERRQGTPLQASDYCKKDGDFKETGEISKQGKRTDITRVVELIQDGNNNKQIAQAEPESYFKFHKHINAYRTAMLEPRNTDPDVRVYWGATGTGKSFTAREIMGEEEYYVWGPENSKWWDGYSGQKNVIMEEFRGQLPFGYLLRLLDRYDMKVEFKGGMCEFCGTHIVITSPKHPKDWYSDYGSDRIDQLLRRINVIREFR